MNNETTCLKKCKIDYNFFMINNKNIRKLIPSKYAMRNLLENINNQTMLISLHREFHI